MRNSILITKSALTVIAAGLLAAGCTSRQPVAIDQSDQIGDIETSASQSGNEDAPKTGRTPTESELLEQYEALLHEETDPGQRAELARRAAELRLQLAAEEPVTDQRLTTGSDRNSWQDTIALLNTSLSPVSGTEGNDRILYQMARTYDLAGDTHGSQHALSRMIEEHPSSELHAEALFRRAEKYFVLADYRRAEADYQRLLNQHRSTAFVAPARHKLAWAIFKQSRYREAVHKLLPLLDELITDARLNSDGSDLKLQGMEASARERLQDSVRVTVLCFALLGSTDGIPALLRGHQTHYRALLYLRLAELYEERGHPAEASRILSSFVGLYPQDKAVTTIRHRIIALLDQSGDQQAALQARASFVSANAGSKDPQTRKLLRKDLEYLTRHYHARAQSGAADKKNQYTLALKWYRLLLQEFPERHDQRYLMAELMLDHGDYRDAARTFETLGYDTPGFSKSREAAYAALLARRNSGMDTDEAALRFTQRYPDHGETGNILIATAESQFSGGHYEQAINTAEKVLAGKPGLQQRLAMLSLTAHANFELGQFETAEEAAEHWLKIAPGNAKKMEDMGELLASSIYRQAQQLVKTGETEEVVKQLLRLGTLAPADLNTPGGKLRANASLQAAQIQLDQKQWSAAIKTLEEMRNAFPGHPQSADVARGLALAYENQGNRQKAAEEYARFSKVTDDPELQRAAAYQTAELHWQAGRLEAARDAFRNYANTYNTPLEVNLKAQNRLAGIYARLKDKRESFWLKKTIDMDAGAGASRSDVTQSFAAKAALRLADIKAEKYKKTGLAMPIDKGIRRKQLVLEEALKSYSKAAGYSVSEVTTAATYQIAELYRDFGRSLLNAPIPRDMSDSERDEMKILLEEQAFPFEEKAIHIHETNVARLDNGLYDAWIDRSLQVLMEMVPGRYAKRELGERIVESL